MSEFKIDLETNLDENLQDKFYKMFCSKCNRCAETNPSGCCVGCETKVIVQIKKLPSLISPKNKCEYLEREDNYFICYNPAKDDLSNIDYNEFCKGCVHNTEENE